MAQATRAKPIPKLEQFGVTECGVVVRLLDAATGGHKAGKIYKACRTTTSPYLYVKLCCKNVAKSYSVHRLVALAWIPNPENLPEVNHKDGDKTNNHRTNLEWVSRSQNKRHAFEVLGVQGPREFKSPRCVVSNEDVCIMKHRHDLGETYKQIARDYEISPTHVGRLIQGTRRGYLNDN